MSPARTFSKFLTSGGTATVTTLPLGPRSVRTAVLLWKRARTQVALRPDYVCFEIPDEFVVGYGLDHNGEYRHLPYIGVLEPHG